MDPHAVSQARQEILWLIRPKRILSKTLDQTRLQRTEFPETRHVQWSEAQDGKEWDAFMLRNGGSVFHLWSWRKVLEGNGSRSLYLACSDFNGDMVAACPFFYRDGKHLMYLDSLPDSHIAGPVVRRGMGNARQVMSSLRKAVRFSPFNPVVAMQLRVHRQDIVRPLMESGYPYNMTHGLFIIDLHATPLEHIWMDGFNKHDRQAVKYYGQQGTEFGLAKSEGDYTEYAAFPKGSSIFSRIRVYPRERAEFISRMRVHAGGRLRVALASKGGEAIAGVSMLCEPENSTLHFAITRYIRENNTHSRVTYLYWNAINWASEQGFRYVDLGAYSIPKSSIPTHPFYRLRERFEAVILPRHEFILPTSNSVYTIASMISRAL